MKIMFFLFKRKKSTHSNLKNDKLCRTTLISTSFFSVLLLKILQKALKTDEFLILLLAAKKLCFLNQD